MQSRLVKAAVDNQRSEERRARAQAVAQDEALARARKMRTQAQAQAETEVQARNRALQLQAEAQARARTAQAQADAQARARTRQPSSAPPANSIPGPLRPAQRPTQAPAASLIDPLPGSSRPAQRPPQRPPNQRDHLRRRLEHLRAKASDCGITFKRPTDEAVVSLVNNAPARRKLLATWTQIIRDRGGEISSEDESSDSD